jgi:hypothetical protein
MADAVLNQIRYVFSFNKRKVTQQLVLKAEHMAEQSWRWVVFAVRRCASQLVKRVGAAIREGGRALLRRFIDTRTQGEAGQRIIG